MSWKDFPLSENEQKTISKLPPDIAALANEYPSDIYNAGEYCDKPPFPDNYIPELIEIYYQPEADGSDVFIMKGVLKDYKPQNLDTEKPFIAVQIDDQWAYIQIEGQVALDRLGGVILPDVIVKISALLESVFKGKNND